MGKASQGKALERPAPLTFAKGVWSRDNQRAEYSKQKVLAQLKELNVEPDSICLEWIVTQAAQNSTRADCWRDCRFKKLHADDASFHRTVPGLKLATCRCDGRGDSAGAKRGRTKE